MSAMDAATVLKKLESLSIASSINTHPEVTSLDTWISCLQSLNPAVKASKTIIVKPKSSNDLIMILSLQDTKYSIGTVSKALGYKDARVAGDDVVMEQFGVGKIDATVFQIGGMPGSGKVVLAVDKELAGCGGELAFRGLSATQSIFVTFDGVAQYLKSVGQEFKILDLMNPGDTLAKAPSEQSVLEKKESEVMMGITVDKFKNFPKWYEQVLTKAEMLDYYDVSGCYILRPSAYAIWKRIQDYMNSKLEEMGVEDCYFPMFITASKLNKEKDHIEGFSPEVAWITKAGSSDLAEPIAVRPTSETVMYPYYANWIRSHRDLPLKLNQWCNVVRWEFKNPQPFLRTREFLWQEGHTAFSTLDEAKTEVLEILGLYRRVYEDLLAVPVILGRKSEKEKFAGGYYTTSVEGFIPATGRGIQGATSHCLGQNFSKMFDIMVDNEEGGRSYVWQNSWGLTTRSIGVMIMVHSDNKGIVLPPKVAQIQVVIVPCGITATSTEAEKQEVYNACDELFKTLKAGGIRAKADLRDNVTPGFKFNHWELRGIPIRLEIGPKDLQKKEVRCVIRSVPKKFQLSMDGIVSKVSKQLEEIQINMYESALRERDSKLVQLETWDKFVDTLNDKCIILSPWCDTTACEEAVKVKSARANNGDEPEDEKAPSMGAKTLCIPFDQPTMNKGQKCFACDGEAQIYALWGRSY